MTVSDFKKLLTQRPFEPFRVVMSSGERYDVRHPEMAWLTRTTLYNGTGIPADELPLAFASHATSKLLTDEDLFRIATKGFRGEALASIGSVSHARLLSRAADHADSAYEIHDRGGAISDPQAAAGNT